MSARVLIVTATTILAESGTVYRLQTAIRAMRELGAPKIRLLGFESPRLLKNRPLVAHRQRWLEQEGVSSRFIASVPQRLPAGRRLNSLWAGWHIHRESVAGQYSVISALNSDAASACSQARIQPGVVRLYDLHGAESEEEVLVGSAARGDGRFRVRTWCEGRGLRWASVVIAPALRAEEWGKSLVPESKATWHSLPTLCSVRLTSEWVRAERVKSRARLGWDSNRIVLYAGGLSEWQQPELMAEVVAETLRRDDAVRFLMLTPHESLANEILRRYGIGHAARVIHTDQAGVFSYGVAADAALLLREDSMVNRVASPTKFAEYLEMGVPVLLTDVLADFCATAAKHGVGEVCASQGAPGYYAAQLVKLLRSSSESRTEVIERCRAAARADFAFDRAVRTYQAVMDSCPVG